MKDKIVFVLPDLAPGRDGVFDYTVRLAAGLEEKGCMCRFLILNGNTIAENYSLEQTIAYDYYPNAMDWADRITRAREVLSKIEPNYISLQYYYHGYKDRRWAVPFHHRAKSLFGNFRLVIMFHELWFEGQSRGGFNKQLKSFAKWLQIIHFLKQTRPENILTNTSIYKKYLLRWGFDSQVQPIFSPFEGLQYEAKKFIDLLAQHIPGLNMETRGNYLIVGVFGRIWGDWDYTGQLNYLVQEANKMGKIPAVVSIGNNALDNRAWSRMKDVTKECKLVMVRIGFQSESGLKKILEGFDFAITPTPYEAKEKSTTISAWNQAGVPVVFTNCLVETGKDLDKKRLESTVQWYLNNLEG